MMCLSFYVMHKYSAPQVAYCDHICNYLKPQNTSVIDLFYKYVLRIFVSLIIHGDFGAKHL